MTVTNRHNEAPDPRGFMTIREVQSLTSLKESTIRSEMKADRFPQSVRLSPGRIAWIRKEVEDWIEKRVRDSRG